MKLRLPFDQVNLNPGPAPSPGGVYLSQGFGENPQIYAQFGLPGHNGWDIAASLGTPIKAMYDGFIIEQISKNTGFGLRITQRAFDGNKHYQIVYGHMQRLELDQDIPWNWNYTNYPVKAGDVIGYVNSTGFSTGNHVHIGIYEYSDSGSPLNYNNGYFGALDPKPFILRKNEMQILQVNGEATLVIKNLEGKYYEVATKPELYQDFVDITGLTLPPDGVNRSEVDANRAGKCTVGQGVLVFIKENV